MICYNQTGASKLWQSVVVLGDLDLSATTVYKYILCGEISVGDIAQPVPS